MTTPDLNAMVREVQRAAREAMRLARAGRNAVAERSAQTFEQTAADAYRNKDAATLENNLTALHTLIRELRVRVTEA